MSSGGVDPAVNPWSAGQFGPAELLAQRKAAADARAGANWFFWIAGLSMINSILALLHVPFGFLLGLAATQMIDSMGMTQSGANQTAAVLNVTLLAIFVVLGFLSRGRRAWAFIVGIVLYALDTLLFLNTVGATLAGGLDGVDLRPLLLAAAIHSYALFRMCRGVTAVWRLTTLARLERQYQQLIQASSDLGEHTAPTYIVNRFGD